VIRALFFADISLISLLQATAKFRLLQDPFSLTRVTLCAMAGHQQYYLR